MPSARQKFSVGLFVIVAGALIIGVMLMLGLSDYFQDGRRYAAYFDESVRGLNPAAEVSYRGVEIGRVESIGIAPDGKHVEVILRVDDKISDPSGLTASIRSLGITGIMTVELEKTAPERRFDPPELPFEPRYPVIATRPSAMARIIAGANEIMDIIQELQIEEMVEDIKTSIDHFYKMITKIEFDAMAADLHELILRSSAVLDVDKWEDIRTSIATAARDVSRFAESGNLAADRVDDFFETNTETIKQAIADIGDAVGNASAFFAQASALAADTGMHVESYDRRLQPMINDLQEAAYSLKLLLDRLSNHPSQAVFGKPVPPKTIEE